MRKRAPYLFVFLLLATALTFPISADEAYYWVWSRRPAWGYYDHPPLVAWLSTLNPWSAAGAFALRAPFLVLTAAAVFWKFRSHALWLLAVPGAHLWLGWALPDTLLLVFGTATVHYFLHWQNEPEKRSNGVLLVLSLAALAYAKYHGVLLALALFLAHPKVFRRPQFYLLLTASFALYLPYLRWLHAHEWTTFQYHLSGRYHGEGGAASLVSFLMVQLLFYFPLLLRYLSWPRWYRILALLMAAVFGWGAWRGSWEAHWTLLLLVGIPYLPAEPSWGTWTRKGPGKARTFKIMTLGVPLRGIHLWVGLLIFARLVSFHPQVRSTLALTSHFREPAAFTRLSQGFDPSQVVFLDQFQDAALFEWYTGEWTTALAHPGIRTFQYQLWPEAPRGDVWVVNRQQLGDPVDGTPFYAAHLERYRDWSGVEAVWSADGNLLQCQGLPAASWPEERLVVYAFDQRKRQIARVDLGPAALLEGGVALESLLVGEGEHIERFLTVECRWIPTRLWVPVAASRLSSKFSR